MVSTNGRSADSGAADVAWPAGSGGTGVPAADGGGGSGSGGAGPGTGGAGPGTGGAPVDAGGTPADAGGSNKVLIYGVTVGGYRHASIPASAAAITRAATAAGLTVEAVGITNQTNVVDRSRFTAAALAPYGAVILLANDAEPFGYPATDEIQNLVEYVRSGGALVAIECVSDSYGGAVSGPQTGHPKSVPFHDLLGGTFAGHPGDFAPASCNKVGAGTHPSVAALAPTFKTVDEIYAFSDFRMDNQVLLTCIAGAFPGTVRPVSFVREEGAGRVFHSSLGHADAAWTMPMDPAVPGSRLLDDHVLPGLLWAMKRLP
ncbi:MAG TPA: ThuA domain-containing protein [Polyangia bacterium]|nr:ThuA domain-containing protein [Polyangia bacterium]